MDRAVVSDRRRSNWRILNREFPRLHRLLHLLLPASDGAGATAAPRLVRLVRRDDACHRAESVCFSLSFAGDIKKAKDAGYHTCEAVLMQPKRVRATERLEWHAEQAEGRARASEGEQGRKDGMGHV